MSWDLGLHKGPPLSVERKGHVNAETLQPFAKNTYDTPGNAPTLAPCYLAQGHIRKMSLDRRRPSHGRVDVSRRLRSASCRAWNPSSLAAVAGTVPPRAPSVGRFGGSFSEGLLVKLI